MAVTFLTAGPLLHADDKPAVPSGEKLVPVRSGGSTTYVRVKDAPDPLRNVSSSDRSGRYDPERIFSTSSSMADKKFTAFSTSLAKGDATFSRHEQNTFITTPYFNSARSGADHTTPNLDAKVALFSAAAHQDATALEFNRRFLTDKADAGQNKTAILSASETSPDQNRTAVLGGQTTKTFAYPQAGKIFRGPEADAVRRRLSPMKNGQMYVTDLPNRPLTVDEVRDLINHGFKPDTDAKPPPPSKPLNDPDYVPQPLRDMPASSPPEIDKDDPVPPPGTMALPPPENSEPLPQR